MNANLGSEKSTNSSFKKHIKIKYKKSFSSLNKIYSNSYDKKNLSIGSKK